MIPYILIILYDNDIHTQCILVTIRASLHADVHNSLWCSLWVCGLYEFIWETGHINNTDTFLAINTSLYHNILLTTRYDRAMIISSHRHPIPSCVSEERIRELRICHSDGKALMSACLNNARCEHIALARRVDAARSDSRFCIYNSQTNLRS